jgi:hypothetical protein
VTKISQLSSIGDSLAVDDQFLIRDVDDGTTPNKSVTVSGITRALPLGSATAPALAFASDKNTGIYSPGADQVAISTNGTGRLTVGTTAVSSTLAVDHPLGAVGTPSITFTGDLNTGFWSPAADTLAASTGGSERLRILSDGKVGLGTSSPSNTAGFSQQLEVAGSLACVSINNTGTGARKYSIGVTGAGALGFWDNTDSAYRIFIDSSGRVGIGTTLPNGKLEVAEATDADNYCYVIARGGNNKVASWVFATKNSSGTNVGGAIFHDGNGLGFSNNTGATGEKARIDSSGRLLVGTSSTRAVEPFANLNAGAGAHVFEGLAGTDTTVIALCSNGTTDAAYGPGILLARTRGTAVGGTTVVADGDTLGTIGFAGADGTDIRTKAASIYAQVDGTPGANDMPGRLLFSTTADGASSPTERLRITNAGVLQIADAGNISVGTTAGTKIGTATTQKLGFYNATPVVQPTAVADATDAASVITQLNDLLAKLRTLGLIAT